MNKQEKKHLDMVASIGCIVCLNLGHGFTECELHHLRHGAGIGQKSKSVIPLCHVHHRTGGYGVAYHQGKKAFESNFGTELELLERVKKLLNF